MANRTARYAHTVHGTNPQYLIENIVRKRIYESKYWKEHCTLLTSADVLERAVDDLRYVGGIYGANIKPTPFICLALKLLQIQPQHEIITFYLKQTEFKYLRALGAFYLRLVGDAKDIYKELEPLYNDYRKLRFMDKSHKFTVIHMDEFIDCLLRDDRALDTVLPRLTKRYVLEDIGQIKLYRSELDELDLIPHQMIEERIEQLKLEQQAGHKDDLRNEEQPHMSGRERDGYESRTYSDNRRDRRSYEERSHNERSSRRGDDHPGDRSDRRRSRSPQSSGRYKQVVKSRFRQQDIDNENAIRAKLGLRPLR